MRAHGLGELVQAVSILGSVGDGDHDHHSLRYGGDNAIDSPANCSSRSQSLWEVSEGTHLTQRFYSLVGFCVA